jgi:hypothetical protein
VLAANRWLPTTAFANRHRRPTPAPKRRRAARHAQPMAANAAVTSPPASRGATSPTATQNRQNPMGAAPLEGLIRPPWG